MLATNLLIYVHECLMTISSTLSNIILILFISWLEIANSTSSIPLALGVDICLSPIVVIKLSCNICNL